MSGWAIVATTVLWPVCFAAGLVLTLLALLGVAELLRNDGFRHGWIVTACVFTALALLGLTSWCAYFARSVVRLLIIAAILGSGVACLITSQCGLR